MYLNDALACELRITPIPCHHEQACGISAEAYGRTGANNHPGFGVAMVTTGPGATNLITPVAGAWIDSLPLLIISGQVKSKDRLGDKPLRQSGVQEVDIIPMVRGITKYAATVQSPESVREHFERAMYLTRSGRPGPVWIEVPLDVQSALIDPLTLQSQPGIEADPSKPIDYEQISRVRSLLDSSKRPLILAGHGVRLSGAALHFRQLIDRLQIPVVSTWNALDLVPYASPFFVGTPGVVALRAPNFAIQNCDLLISIGCRLDNVITAYNPKNFAKSAKKVVVDIDSEELDKDGIDAAEKVHLNASDFIAALSDVSPSTSIDRTNWVNQCSLWKERYSPTNEQREIIDGEISHYQLVDHLSELIPENTLVVTGSSGMSIESFYSTFCSKQGQRLFLTSGLGSMGYGLSAAIGGCLGNDTRYTVLIESDGSMMLNLQELATLKALELPVKAIIFDNDGYASIRNTQKNYFDSRFIATSTDSGLYIPDLEKVTESFGLYSVTLRSLESLRADLAEFFQKPGPGIAIVKLSPNETLTPKVAAMPQADGSIISMPLEDMTPLLDVKVLSSEMKGELSPASLRARNLQNRVN
jgi:acetolactate synthase-1/2/3 large subunit